MNTSTSAAIPWSAKRNVHGESISNSAGESLMENQIEPCWRAVEVTRVANGFMVRQAYTPHGHGSVAAYSLDECYVFEAWDQCAAFLKRITK